MAESPVDVITEVMNDLNFSMEAGGDLDYHRTDDGRIAIRIYDEQGNLGDVKGYLTFEEA